MNDRWEGGCWFGFLLVSYGWICGNQLKIVGLESTSLESDEKLLRCQICVFFKGSMFGGCRRLCFPLVFGDVQ